jgi:hypothetical protein
MAHERSSPLACTTRTVTGSHPTAAGGDLTAAVGNLTAAGGSLTAADRSLPVTAATDSADGARSSGARPV